MVFVHSVSRPLTHRCGAARPGPPPGVCTRSGHLPHAGPVPFPDLRAPSPARWQRRARTGGPAGAVCWASWTLLGAPGPPSPWPSRPSELSACNPVDTTPPAACDPREPLPPRGWSQLRYPRPAAALLGAGGDLGPAGLGEDLSSGGHDPLPVPCPARGLMALLVPPPAPRPSTSTECLPTPRR